MRVLYRAPGQHLDVVDTSAAWSLSDVFEHQRYLACQGPECAVSLGVWRATGETVVIKSYTKCRLSKTAREQVDTELQIHCSLMHEHVTPLLLALEDDRCIHMAVQWAEGGDLRQLLARSSAMSERLLKDTIIRPLLQALVLLEQQGVVHRDLKPDNVLLHNGKAQLADFGLAVYNQLQPALCGDAPSMQQQHASMQACDSPSLGPPSPPSEAGLSCISTVADDSHDDSAMSSECDDGQPAAQHSVVGPRSRLPRPASSPDLMSSACGTPLYTAPEVLRAMFESRPIHEVVSHKNDVWALGVMALEALQGSHPLSQASNLLYSVAHHKAFHLPAHLSLAATQWLAAATQADPAQRPSASQLLAHEWMQAAATPITCSSPMASSMAHLSGLRLSVSVGLPGASADYTASPSVGGAAVNLRPSSRRGTPTAASLASCKVAASVWSPKFSTDRARAYEPDCWEY